MESEQNEEKKEYFTKSKEYYKNYYKQHKTELLAKICAKATCPFCSKEVCKVNMPNHKRTKLCLKRQEQKLKDEIRMDKLHYETGLKYLLLKGEDHYRTTVN
jgi:hypothetical protein